MPLSVRAEWIQKLDPTVEVIKGKDDPTEVGYTERIKAVHEQYIRGLLNGRRTTHVYSSELYGEHMSQALQAVNRVVDMERRKISSFRNRDTPGSRKHISSIHPEVYKDLITNILFLGAPSTGKTTIAEACARHFSASWMPEYGREYWEKYHVDRRLTPEQLVELAKGHLAREEQKLVTADKYLFTDTNAITTFMFSMYYHGYALPELAHLARLAECRYQLVSLCDTDIPYEDTWDRSGDVNRKEFQREIRADLERRGVRFKVLRGV